MKSLTALAIVTLVTITFSCSARNLSTEVKDAGESALTSRQQQLAELERLGL